MVGHMAWTGGRAGLAPSSAVGMLQSPACGRHGNRWMDTWASFERNPTSPANVRKSPELHNRSLDVACHAWKESERLERGIGASAPIVGADRMSKTKCGLVCMREGRFGPSTETGGWLALTPGSCGHTALDRQGIKNRDPAPHAAGATSPGVEVLPGSRVGPGSTLGAGRPRGDTPNTCLTAFHSAIFSGFIPKR